MNFSRSPLAFFQDSNFTRVPSSRLVKICDSIHTYSLTSFHPVMAVRQLMIACPDKKKKHKKKNFITKNGGPTNPGDCFLPIRASIQCQPSLSIAKTSMVILNKITSPCPTLSAHAEPISQEPCNITSDKVSR